MPVNIIHIDSRIVKDFTSGAFCGVRHYGRRSRSITVNRKNWSHSRPFVETRTWADIGWWPAEYSGTLLMCGLRGILPDASSHSRGLLLANSTEGHDQGHDEG